MDGPGNCYWHALGKCYQMTVSHNSPLLHVTFQLETCAYFKQQQMIFNKISAHRKLQVIFISNSFTLWSYVRLTLILRRSRTGTVWFYTSTSNKRAARPKLYTKSLTRDLKCMYSRFTLVRISINL